MAAVIKGDYRYLLTRILWANDKHKKVTWVMLNPSTANADTDDNTIRKITGFSERWGFGMLSVVNLFALRSTNPHVLKSHRDPIGPENKNYLYSTCDAADTVVVAWGAHGVLFDRGRTVLGGLLDKLPEGRLKCFGYTKMGQPKHPLYLPNDTQLIGV